MITNLGYPVYFITILGIWKMLGVVAVLVPKFPLLKEWAYAGSAFTWVMAFIAHYSGGDGVQVWAMPLVLLALLIVSYFSRPSNRRMALSPSRA